MIEPASGLRLDNSEGATVANLPAVNQPLDQEDVGHHPPDPDQDYFFLYYEYDQHRRPKKNDIIFYFDGDLQDWAEVRILSKTKYPHNFNIRFLMFREEMKISTSPLVIAGLSNSLNFVYSLFLNLWKKKILFLQLKKKYMTRTFPLV